MPLTRDELFEQVTSFAPSRVELRGAPWDELVDWVIAHGLGPLVAHNLEYRLGATQVPEWVRHRLLSVYQGSANDNVMKLVNLKRALDPLEGRKVVLVGAAAFADTLYPHIAFRPVGEVRLAVAPAHLGPIASWLARSEFKPAPSPDPARAELSLTDDRTQLFVHARLLDDDDSNERLLARALPARAFGPSAFRLEAEDALLVQVLLLARQGFEVPVIELLDCRELVNGAPGLGGPYSRPLDAERLAERANAWSLERALWATLRLVERLWPTTEAAVTRLRPTISAPVRAVLERVLVGPLGTVGRTEGPRGADVLRSLLTGT